MIRQAIHSMKLTVRKKLLLSIVPPAIFVYVLIVYVQTAYRMKADIHRMESALHEITRKYAAQCDIFFTRSAQVVETAAAFLATNPHPSRKEITAFFRHILEQNPDFVGFGVGYEPGEYEEGRERFDPFVYRETSSRNGGILEYPLGEFDYFSREWYDRTRKSGKSFWTEPYLGEAGNTEPMCTYAAPFYRDGRLIGVVAADIALNDLSRIVTSLPGEGIFCRLVTKKGIIISEENQSLTQADSLFDPEAIRDTDISPATRRRMASGEGGMAVYNDPDQGKLWLAFAPLKQNHWQLLASTDGAMILQPIYHDMFRSLVVFFIGLLLIIGVLTIVSYRVLIPLSRLSRFAKRLATGDFDTKVGGILPNDEIGELARTFDKMVADLRKSVDRLLVEEAARNMLEGELRTARRIQHSLLPRIFPPFPNHPEFDLHAMNEPATFMAGDFFDFFFSDADTLTIVMADVSGKGVPAAMFMAVSRTAIRNFTIPGLSPAEIIRQTNVNLSADNANMMFVTLFYGQYHIQTGEMTYVNAGHNPPYFIKSDGTMTTLEATGMVLGAFEEAEYTQETIRFEPNDLLVTFTDGVTEAHTVNTNELYGEERLETLLERCRGESADKICSKIFQSAIDFSRGERHDDITLLVLRRNQ